MAIGECRYAIAPNSYWYPRIITFLCLKLSEQRNLSYLPHIFEKLVLLSLHMYLYSKGWIHRNKLWCSHQRGQTLRRHNASSQSVWRIFNRFFKIFDILLKNATEIGVVRNLSVQNLDRTWSTRPLADRARPWLQSRPHTCVQALKSPTHRRCVQKKIHAYISCANARCSRGQGYRLWTLPGRIWIKWRSRG